MESVNLEMNDLFENEAMDDDDIGAVSALPDLPDYREDDGEGDGEGREQDNEDAGRFWLTPSAKLYCTQNGQNSIEFWQF